MYSSGKQICVCENLCSNLCPEHVAHLIPKGVLNDTSCSRLFPEANTYSELYRQDQSCLVLPLNR